MLITVLLLVACTATGFWYVLGELACQAKQLDGLRGALRSIADRATRAEKKADDLEKMNRRWANDGK